VPTGTLRLHLGIRVHGIIGMSGRQNQILISVQVRIQKRTAPGPLRGRQIRKPRHLRKTAIPTSDQQHVLHHLDPRGRVTKSGDFRRNNLVLPLPPGIIAAEHIGQKQIHMPVRVDVGDGHRHGGLTGLPHIVAGGCTELPRPVTEPDMIRAFKVVAYIQIRPSVPVEVLKAHSQRPVQRGPLEGVARLIQKCPLRPIRGGKGAGTIINIQHVRLSQLHQHQPAALTDHPVMHGHGRIDKE